MVHLGQWLSISKHAALFPRQEAQTFANLRTFSRNVYSSAHIAASQPRALVYFITPCSLLTLYRWRAKMFSGIHKDASALFT